MDRQTDGQLQGDTTNLQPVISLNTEDDDHDAAALLQVCETGAAAQGGGVERGQFGHGHFQRNQCRMAKTTQRMKLLSQQLKLLSHSWLTFDLELSCS